MAPISKPPSTGSTSSFITQTKPAPAPAPAPVVQSKPAAEKKSLPDGIPIIFVGGGPGSGKGTQCEKMIAKYGFTHLSSGDLIRAAAQDSSTEKGRYFNEMMSQGKLISTVIKSVRSF